MNTASKKHLAVLVFYGMMAQKEYEDN